jgi:hypothetical protein
LEGVSDLPSLLILSSRPRRVLGREKPFSFFTDGFSLDPDDDDDRLWVILVDGTGFGGISSSLSEVDAARLGTLALRGVPTNKFCDYVCFRKSLTLFIIIGLFCLCLKCLFGS